MSKKQKIAGAFLLLICLLIFWQWRNSVDGYSRPDENQSTLFTNAHPVKRVLSNEPPASISSSPTGSTQNVRNGPRDAGTKKDGTPSAFYSSLRSREIVSIEFYGKVIDENSNTVSGANVSFEWPEEVMGRGVKRTNAESDANGLFSLRNVQGSGVDVRITKKGYYTPGPGVACFNYAGGFSSDPLNPVIFKLRTKGLSEPLIRLAGAMGGGRPYRLDAKGTPTELSFYTGRRVATGGGNFRVEYWMETQNSNTRRYQWRCRITVPGGGLQSTSEEFPFMAPESGYVESIELRSESPTEPWSNRVNQSYFFRLPDRKYGRVKLGVICSDNPFFRVEVLVNPSGSRNLEYDKDLAGNIMVNQSSPSP